MSRGFKRSIPDTKARGFKHPDSFVSLADETGVQHELLKGDDWKERKIEVHRRDHGMCQLQRAPNCRPVCGRFADPHHLIDGRGKRCDCLHNVVTACRACHNFIDHRKPKWSTP